MAKDDHRDTVDPASLPAGGDEKKDVTQLERTQSPEFDKSGLQNFNKMDKELAQYVSDARIHISDEEDKRLRRLIDKRVLAIMVTTYFLQAIDKGTMSFASIMGIVDDTGLKGQEVGTPLFHPHPSTHLTTPH
jgi:hypothetical protein